MANQRLADALQAVRPALEAELGNARAELADLDARRAELLALIAQAESALGLASHRSLEVTGGTAGVPGSAGGARGRTLHDVMVDVLREQGNAGMTAADLAREINARGLYRQRDGGPVPANQIHARTRNYSHLFEKAGSLIRVKNV